MKTLLSKRHQLYYNIMHRDLDVIIPLLFVGHKNIQPNKVKEELVLAWFSL